MPRRPWPHTLYKIPKNGFCIWQWEKGKWSMIFQMPMYGYMCGDAPKEDGKYEGEKRLQYCIKETKRRKKKH